MSTNKKDPPRIRLGEGTDDYDVEVTPVRVVYTSMDYVKSFAIVVVGTFTATAAYELIVIALT